MKAERKAEKRELGFVQGLCNVHCEIFINKVHVPVEAEAFDSFAVSLQYLSDDIDFDSQIYPEESVSLGHTACKLN